MLNSKIIRFIKSNFELFAYSIWFSAYPIAQHGCNWLFIAELYLNHMHKVIDHYSFLIQINCELKVFPLYRINFRIENNCKRTKKTKCLLNKLYRRII